MTQAYTLDAEHVTQELSIAHPVSIEDQSAALSDVTEHAVTVELDPDVMLVTAGEQGPPGTPGPSAFDDWLARNPGGTFEQFLAAIGSGGGLISQKILRFYDASGALHYFALNERLELPIQLTDDSMSSVVTIGVLHGRA